MVNLRVRPDAARQDLARFTIWRNQTWDHAHQKPWPNGLALDEKAQAREEPDSDGPPSQRDSDVPPSQRDSDGPPSQRDGCGGERRQ